VEDLTPELPEIDFKVKVEESAERTERGNKKGRPEVLKETTTMAKIPGYILYDGPSMLDGKPIIAVATMKSNNAKTGNMVQVWILRKDLSPTDAIHSGEDASICGTCPHRGIIVDGKNKQRSCYVRVFHGPTSVWKSFHKGNYVPLELEDMPTAFAGRFVRLGAYGDPGALPREVIEWTLLESSGWTGYTHAWKRRADIAPWCMASCDTARDEAQARLLGFRCFRVTADVLPTITKKHFICPASEEGGHKLQCFECGACNGKETGRKSHVQIAVHGPQKKWALPILQAG
jgi:hypothetical protein